MGGIPRREAIEAWFAALLNIEYAAIVKENNDAQVYGASIDTMKYFDHLIVEDAALALANLGLPADVVQTWYSWSSGHLRLYSYAGLIEVEPSMTARGIAQGCPLSMTAANAVMSAWIAWMAPSDILLRTYVDDRILLCHDEGSLQQAISKTEAFDNEHKIYSKIKSSTWSHGLQRGMPLSFTGAQEKLLLKEPKAYLGLPILTKPTSSQAWYAPIMKKVEELTQRASLAGRLGEAADRVVKAKIIPMMAHSAIVIRPNATQYRQVRTWIRRLTWTHRPWAMWELVHPAGENHQD